MTAAYGHIMIRGVLRKGDANDFRDMIMNPRDRSLFIDSMCDYWYSSPRATISVATSRVKISSISNLNLMICPSTFSPMKLSRILSIPPGLRTTTSNQIFPRPSPFKLRKKSTSRRHLILLFWIMSMRELFFLFVALSLRMILSLIWRDTNTNGRREMLIKYAVVLLKNEVSLGHGDDC